METLERLTRREVDALGTIGSRETSERGVSLKSTATLLHVRPPSALSHLTALEEMGLIARHRGKSRLTPKGRMTLVEYQRHHRAAESLFSPLGLSPEKACAAAREVDLAISHETVERICAVEGAGSVGPHDDPRPARSARKRGA